MAPLMKIINRIIKIVLLLALLVEAAFLLAEKIDLTTADLGRHITNGKVVLSQGLGSAVLHQNFYSYTQPEFPTINHHWGSGVVFYWLTQIGGFGLDSIFYIVMGVLTLLVMFDVTRKIANFWIALGLSSLLLPLMMSRTEVRPETMTYSFSAVFFWVLWHYRFKIKDIRFKKLIWILPVITLFWVNIHIGWFFGPLLVILFFAGEAWKFFFRRHSEGVHPTEESPNQNEILRSAQDDAKSRIRQLILVLVLCGVTSLINPNFIKGALEPLTIFKSYGYLIVENQTVPFLEHIDHSAGLHFTLLKIMIALLALGIISAVIRRRRELSPDLILLGITVSVMAWFGLRNFPFFGFFALPVLAYCAASLGLKSQNKILVAYAASISLLIFAGGIYRDYLVVQARGITEGIGLLPGAESSANFFKQNNINGPIFNDYDIGGYLIYELQKQDEHGSGQQINTNLKVFVDNRPEAYSVDFFQNIYIPAQQDNNRWKQLYDQYQFNSIFFSYRDLTPWAQAFLIARAQDAAWAPVFADSYNIIFLKRNSKNDLLIKKYELPKSLFGIRQ
jgi:hypothetical protein